MTPSAAQWKKNRRGGVGPTPTPHHANPAGPTRCSTPPRPLPHRWAAHTSPSWPDAAPGSPPPTHRRQQVGRLGQVRAARRARDWRLCRWAHHPQRRGRRNDGRCRRWRSGSGSRGSGGRVGGGRGGGGTGAAAVGHVASGVVRTAGTASLRHQHAPVVGTGTGGVHNAPAAAMVPLEGAAATAPVVSTAWWGLPSGRHERRNAPLRAPGPSGRAAAIVLISARRAGFVRAPGSPRHPTPNACPPPSLSLTTRMDGQLRRSSPAEGPTNSARPLGTILPRWPGGLRLGAAAVNARQRTTAGRIH